MTIRASGRAASIIAAGIGLCILSPVQAAEQAEGGITASKSEAAGPPVALSKFRKSPHSKHASSQRKPAAVASKTSTKTRDAKTAGKKRSIDLALKDEDASALPSSVANARAQLADADVSPESAAAITQARDRLQVMAANQPDAAAEPAANTELVAADQLNEVDRALSESKSNDKPPAAVQTMTVAQAPASAAAAAAAAAAADDSAWGQTSLIGKIFIAFGALLTLASAARMFMA
jgi:hypothetical protein